MSRAIAEVQDKLTNLDAPVCGTTREGLVLAAALIIAKIQRIDRGPRLPVETEEERELRERRASALTASNFA